MKFTSNSSPSSASFTSSYSTANFNETACHSKPGCIGGALRRFLCFNNTLPTHLSDHFQEAENVCQPHNYAESERTETVNAEASATPGLVARLMGLDSMPMVDFVKLDSVRRTRSMDSLRDIELVQGKHRHVKSTLSFRDAPTFLDLENEDFFILSFESGGENKELGLKPRKSDLGYSEMRPKRSEKKTGDKNKRRQNVQERDKENQETVRVSDNKRLQAKNCSDNSKDPRKFRPINNFSVDSKSPEVVNQIKKAKKNTETRERGKLRRKKKEQSCSEIVQKECESENTSPVSVLDFSEPSSEFEVSSPAVHNARLTTSNSRRTLFEELKNYNSSALIISRIIDTPEAEIIKDKCVGIWSRSHKHSQNYAEMWEEVCRFAETDMKQTKWMYRETRETQELDEITAAFEFEILDQLLQELLDQVLT